MKYKFLSVLTIVIALITLSQFVITVSADPAVMIYDYTLSPEIFMPGDTGVLTLTVKNAETAATYVSSSTTNTYTYTSTDTIGATITNIGITSAYNGNKEVKAKLNYEDVGYIAPGSSFDIEFEILADENITEGLYFPKVNIDLEESNVEDVCYPIKVKVSNESVDLVATDVPSKISVSGSTDITLTAVNNREASVDAVTITPQDADGFQFVQDSVFVGSLDSYSSSEVSFSIIPSKTGTTNLTFEISFKNGDNLHSKTLEIPIEIIETLDVSPVIYNIPTSIAKGESGKLRLEVYNAKNEAISGVIVTPSFIDENIGISPSEYFIGSMDPDDVFSASFDVYTGGLEIGTEYTVEFKVSFKQDDNYYETPSVSSSFKVVKPVDKNQVDIPCFSGIILLIVTIVAIVLYYIFKRRRIAR